MISVKASFSATMVIDCDADIRSSTSPSSRKFKSSTNRATPWTSSSLTRSHDSPSQVAPSLYLATQTAISVWIKRRFGNFLVWNGYIFCCFCLLVFPLTYAPLYSCSSCGGACVDSCSYSASCNASLKTSLWPTSSSSALVEQKISNNLASDAAPYSYSCSSSSFPEICSFSAPDGPGHPGAHLKNVEIRYVWKKYLKYSKSKISMLPSFSPPLLHIFPTTSTLRGRRRLQHLCLALGGPELRTGIFEEYLRNI